MKEFPDKVGYHWAPAAMEKLYFNSVTRQPTDQFSPTMEKKTKRGLTYFVMKGFGTRLVYSANLSMKGSWYPGRDLLKELSFGLYNAHDKTMKDSHFKLATSLGEYVYRIQDSGGFQLFSGVKDFIDPAELVHYHDRFADSGVSLDLPLSTVHDLSVVKAGARMLAANSDTLLKLRKGNWQLMNVSHGVTPQLRAAWQSIALKEPCDSLCIAGLRGSISKDAVGANPLAVASHMLVGMLHPNNYRHYHLLGLSSLTGMILAALIANLHGKVVTSDSTTYLNGQQFGNYGYNPIDPATEYNFRRLHCSCKMCAFVEFEYWAQKNAYFLSIHNAYRISHICATVNGMMRQALQKKLDARGIMRFIMLSNIGLSNRYAASMTAAIDLILNTTSYAVACGLNTSLDAPILGTLFKRVAPPPEDLSRQILIIRNYEKYHGKKFLKE